MGSSHGHGCDGDQPWRWCIITEQGAETLISPRDIEMVDKTLFRSRDIEIGDMLSLELLERFEMII